MMRSWPWRGRGYGELETRMDKWACSVSFQYIYANDDLVPAKRAKLEQALRRKMMDARMMAVNLTNLQI